MDGTGMVQLWTVQLGMVKKLAVGKYADMPLLPGRLPVLDVTVKGAFHSGSAGALGAVFAPTWELVSDWKAGRITWAGYTERYTALMRHRFLAKSGGPAARAAWQWVLLQKKLAFGCYCKAGEHCHRQLLAEIFEKIGEASEVEVQVMGEYGMERPTPQQAAAAIVQHKLL